MPDQFERLRIARDSFKDLARENAMVADKYAVENAQLRAQLHDSAMDHIARDIGDEQDAGNLITLAKMYGEACGELQNLRWMVAGNLVIEVVEDEEQGRELLAAIQAVSEARDAAAVEIAALKAENSKLRGIISDSAAAIGNGASIGPECSLEFMSWLPKEIAGVTEKLRSALSSSEKEISDER